MPLDANPWGFESPRSHESQIRIFDDVRDLKLRDELKQVTRELDAARAQYGVVRSLVPSSLADGVA